MRVMDAVSRTVESQPVVWALQNSIDEPAHRERRKPMRAPVGERVLAAVWVPIDHVGFVEQAE
jgi:hypothetical protein